MLFFSFRLNQNNGLALKHQELGRGIYIYKHLKIHTWWFNDFNVKYYNNRLKHISLLKSNIFLVNLKAFSLFLAIVLDGSCSSFDCGTVMTFTAKVFIFPLSLSPSLCHFSILTYRSFCVTSFCCSLAI